MTDKKYREGYIAACNDIMQVCWWAREQAQDKRAYTPQCAAYAYQVRAQISELRKVAENNE